MFDMSTAPKDGTRILIKCQVFGYVPHLGRYTPHGTKWQECRFHEGKWAEWCGNSRTQSTSSVDPLGWVPLPSSEITPAAGPKQCAASGGHSDCPSSALPDSQYCEMHAHPRRGPWSK